MLVPNRLSATAALMSPALLRRRVMPQSYH
jgi:hypothetical protein